MDHATADQPSSPVLRGEHPRRGRWIDLLTQRWVCATGRLLDLREHAWLAGPSGEPWRIGADFFERYAHRCGLRAHCSGGDGGLVASMDELCGGGFDADRLAPAVRDFYEHTAAYQLDLWSQWCGVFRPLGWVIRRVFAAPLQQLNLPMHPLATAHGITSQIVELCDAGSGRRVTTGWLRRTVEDGAVLYAGCYGTCTPPGLGRPCVKVVFPLPNGSATVIMRPELRERGSLLLLSEGRRIGDAGFYFLVYRSPTTASVRYVRSMRETIAVAAGENGAAHADHTLTLWRMTFLRMRYRMVRAPGERGGRRCP